MPGCSRQVVILHVNGTFCRADQVLKSYGDVIKQKNMYKVGLFPTFFIIVEVYLQICMLYCHQLYLDSNSNPNLEYFMILGSLIWHMYY